MSKKTLKTQRPKHNITLDFEAALALEAEVERQCQEAKRAGFDPDVAVPDFFNGGNSVTFGPQLFRDLRDRKIPLKTLRETIREGLVKDGYPELRTSGDRS